MTLRTASIFDFLFSMTSMFWETSSGTHNDSVGLAGIPRIWDILAPALEIGLNVHAWHSCHVIRGGRGMDVENNERVIDGRVSATAQRRLTWVRPEVVQVQRLLGAVETLSHALLGTILTNVKHITQHYKSVKSTAYSIVNRRSLHGICGLTFRCCKSSGFRSDCKKAGGALAFIWTST